MWGQRQTTGPWICRLARRARVVNSRFHKRPSLREENGVLEKTPDSPLAYVCAHAPYTHITQKRLDRVRNLNRNP